MRVAVAQITCELGDSKANLQKASAFVADSAQLGCRLVVLPEMSDTGYVMDVVNTHAGGRPGYFYDGICSLAATHKLYIACGMSERVGTRMYNSMLIAGPDGREKAWYRKVHLFASKPVFENNTFEAGEEFCVVDIDSLRCGLMICYDLRFPEQARVLMRRGAEAIIVASAWPQARQNHWKLLTQTRAVENQLWVIASNRCGTDKDLTLCGSSAIIDPWGEVVAAASQSNQKLIHADIPPDSVSTIRQRFPVLTHRRDDLY